MKDIAIIVYTHTDYKDVWVPFFSQAKKWLPDECKKYIFVDKFDQDIPKDYIVKTYDDSQIYTKRFSHCLKQVDAEFCILHHEDMFLFEPPQINRIAEYVDILKKEDYDFVKLIKGGEVRDIPLKDYSDLKIISQNSNWIFAIQPTLWKTDKLLRLYSEAEGNTIWKFEIQSQKWCRANNIKGLYSHGDGKQRGRLHWDSTVYPYIATAIVKGKWNLKEYPEELGQILDEYKIDKRIRGFV